MGLDDPLATLLAKLTLGQSGRPMIYLFEKLPTKKELPDYYILIERPIDLVGIENKVKKDAYPSMKEFKADVDLMFNNAKKYNMPGSDIYKDATALHKHFTSAAGKAKIPAAGTAPPALKITLKSSLIAGEAAVAGEKKEERDPSLRKKLTEGGVWEM